LKPLLLNTNDIKGGAAKAAYRLHCGLKDIGVNSLMLVGQKHSDDISVISRWNKLGGYLRPRLDMLPLKLYPNRNIFPFHPAYLPERLAADALSYNPDIIHLHWICSGYLRIETLKKFHIPIVWTLHDSWAFTGGCHLPFECKRYQDCCGKCPILGSEKEHDLSYHIWKRKKTTWKDLDLTVVTPSRWLAGCAKSSSLFRDINVEAIPNGLDTEQFKTGDRVEARRILSLPQDKKLLLFGAKDSINDKNKGFVLLVSALRLLAQKGWSDKAEMIIFGASEPTSQPDPGLKFHFMGHLHNNISLANLYVAADVFVLPSIQENLPNTIMESLACGTPVVAFDVGGVGEMVEHKKNGYLVKALDTTDLAEAIEWVLGDQKRLTSLGIAAREKAVSEYSIELQTKRYLDLYQEITGKSTGYT
jgi:glycosyltransferase involved in cell wall biosynthesis